MDDLVDAERWKRWLLSRRGRDRWRRWAEEHPTLHRWEVDELAAPRWSPRTDRMQHGLVALAQAGEGDAAVTLLVQLRPGLTRLVGSVAAARSEARPQAADEVRAVFYETVYRHRLDRRPRRIAANLVLDTRQRLSRASDRAHRCGPAPTEAFERLPHRLAPTERDGELAPFEARSVLGSAIGRLPGSERSRDLTARAAWRAWILDQPHQVVADELGLAPAAVAARLHRLRKEVRAQWSDDELRAA